MTVEAITSILQSYSPDHLPSIRVSFNNSLADYHIHLDSYSIIKFKREHYSGDFEVFNPNIFDDVYRSPTIIGIIDFILTVDPSLIYSPTSHPELFL